MKKDLKAILKKLERIEENQMGQLSGGFISPNTSSVALGLAGANNCRGGTCQSNNCFGGNCGATCKDS